MTSIIQVQRFEIAILSFNNCQSHLTAALNLFRRLLDSSGAVEPSSSFNAVTTRLGLSTSNLPSHCLQFPSAEQAAFGFSSALLIFDDIIASTMLQERPKLYDYHRSLLGDIDCINPSINLEVVVGCQNWTLLQISQVAVLDA
ncbi:hypothetical protein D0Z07_1237 [Hyphodiscus hymeniophilus]|uniref:Uncharacterized protein n=1 Tax=Hyphodiscus hymeniophilus TaxID=353542 RepID=A0A9P6VPR1_9HELO|nr:hypothetical protein D0Z07_1237 [Hyphodiscus hymeniophilus]